ncbi:hypothetical protein RND71_043264 [Anisodus tanguticus]|uniref:Uncharacterized protein n=1 Tax=Anisodus tanguticus TaxID=243964 RepID=A0AAE1QPA6_9SOLA|nr:hypothetical protein RND71_043264 [Anisodus tanguticus]
MNSIYNEDEENDESLRKPIKRIKLEVDDNEAQKTENKVYSKDDLLNFFQKELTKKQESYVDHLLELFFLEQQGNLMEYYTWRKKLPSITLLQYFRTVAKDDESEYESLQLIKAGLDFASLGSVKIVPLSQLRLVAENSSNTTNLAQPPINSSAVSNVTSLSSVISHNNASSLTTPSTASKSNVNNQSSKNVISLFTTPSLSSKTAHNNSSFQASKSLPATPINNKKLRVNSIGISSVYESSIGSQEQIVERAKQEAHVMQRISELRKEGLWSAKRLPRIQEPPREKAHWDYLLEEMEWLATDFAQERKWKKAAAKKCARMVMKYHTDKESQFEKAEKENLLRLKKIASSISKEVKQFWSSVEKLVEFKIQTKLEEKRKKALDIHLSYIVDQTEKYSSWLVEGLNKNGTEVVEKKNKQHYNEKHAENVLTENQEKKKEDDEEFNLDSEDEEDDENTIAEQEKQENKIESAQELKDLEDEANIPIEKLLEKLGVDLENEDCDESLISEEETDVEETGDEEESVESDENSNEEVEKEEVGVEYLINFDSEKTIIEKKSGPTLEITDIAAGAESIQPKGNTLSAVQVQTKVPFLLKGSLREYQHIGLDWLVAMYDKKLNGILADEMGLGKTIQTISLLAHLACEKGVNLTGADTVIFYDSDWNPTMDAQAQDRCHRIGQTRDVHIYRLISEKTVEENILKKARQKKFLGDVAIEGGNFTTAFFKNDSIKDLFNVSNEKSDKKTETRLLIEEIEDEKMSKMKSQLGQALHAAEEENDINAAKTATAEASAEFAEFDESIPLDVDRVEEKSPEEEELEKLIDQHRAERIAKDKAKNQLFEQNLARQKLIQIQKQQQIIQCQQPVKTVVTSNVVANNSNATQFQQPFQSKINPVINQNSLTVSKASVQQFVAAPSNINMSITANQQVSNLAKALSQAAATFQAQNSQQQTQVVPTPTVSVSNVIQQQPSRINTANISVNQTTLPKIISQSPVSMSNSQTTAGGTVLSVASIPPPQKIIAATITNSNPKLTSTQLAAYKQQYLFRQSKLQQIQIQPQLQTQSSVQAQLQSQASQIIPTTQTTTSSFGNARVQISNNVMPLTAQQQVVQCTTQNIKPNSSNTLITTSGGVPIVPITSQPKISDIAQIMQARNTRVQTTTLQQPQQQQIIASLATKPISTTVMSSTTLPVAVPIGSGQHQKIFTSTRSPQIYARKPTEEELDQIFPNRNQQKNQNSVTSTTVQQTNSVSTTQQQQSGSISIPALTQVQFLHIQSPANQNVQSQQISKEGTSSSAGTAYFIYTKGNSK